jgi:3',5'-cyclic AMP phosphodiesterase CpdA
MYEPQVDAFRKTIARVSDSIPLLFLPGNHDIGNDPTVASLDAYRLRFGADYYGFWYGGLRCLVLNSTLMQNPTALPRETSLQDDWFAEEIEQAKLSSTHCLIFTHHPWFLDNIDEDDSYW